MTAIASQGGRLLLWGERKDLHNGPRATTRAGHGAITELGPVISQKHVIFTESIQAVIIRDGERTHCHAFQGY